MAPNDRACVAPSCESPGTQLARLRGRPSHPHQPNPRLQRHPLRSRLREAPYRAFFEQYVDRYIGIDWSESLHEIHADIIAKLNAPLPMASEFADTVVSISVLEHLCEPQIMLGEACRILKPGGF